MMMSCGRSRLKGSLRKKDEWAKIICRCSWLRYLARFHLNYRQPHLGLSFRVWCHVACGLAYADILVRSEFPAETRTNGPLSFQRSTSERRNYFVQHFFDQSG